MLRHYVSQAKMPLTAVQISRNSPDRLRVFPGNLTGFGSGSSSVSLMLSKLKCHDHLLRSGWIGRRGEGIVEPRPELPVREQVHAEQRHRIRHRPTPARLQLHQSRHQHGDQGGPHLGLHRRRGGAHEGLDLQILLQRLEEGLHRPAVLINRGDGLGGEPEVVRQKLKLPLLLLIVEAHQPKLVGASVLCLWATEANHLVSAHGAIGRARNRQVLHRPVHGVALQTRQEIHSLIRPAAKELVVVIPSVIHDDRPGLQFQCLRHRHVVNLAGRDRREARGACQGSCRPFRAAVRGL